MYWAVRILCISVGKSCGGCVRGPAIGAAQPQSVQLDVELGDLVLPVRYDLEHHKEARVMVKQWNF
jgi:hypothetical protein